MITLDGTALLVHDRVILVSECAHVAEKWARILFAIRDDGMPYRDAMRALTQDLGMCEDYASKLYTEIAQTPSHSNLN